MARQVSTTILQVVNEYGVVSHYRAKISAKTGRPLLPKGLHPASQEDIAAESPAPAATVSPAAKPVAPAAQAPAAVEEDEAPAAPVVTPAAKPKAPFVK